MIRGFLHYNRPTAAITRRHGSCTTSHTSLTTINAAKQTFEQNKNRETKNLFMQTLAHEFVSFKDNHKIQNEIKAVAEAIKKEDPNFWMPHQSFEDYINTLSRFQNWHE